MWMLDVIQEQTVKGKMQVETNDWWLGPFQIQLMQIFLSLGNWKLLWNLGMSDFLVHKTFLIYSHTKGTVLDLELI